MKTIFLLSLVFLGYGLATAQDGITLCGPGSNTAAFASLAGNADFRNTHLLPYPYQHLEATGENITFATPHGKEGAAYLIRSESSTDKYLLVIHEWWGLNDHIRQEAERLSEELKDVHVMALDIYDGRVATTREEAARYMQGVEEERAEAIIEGAIQFAGRQAAIGTIGWCFGGGWSLRATILAGEQAAGCVMYYGMPVQEAEEIQEIQADVLGIFAEQDQFITPQIASTFEQAMQEAGKDITLRIFDAGHGFANPSSDSYQQQAAQEANKMALAFLKEHL